MRNQRQRIQVLLLKDVEQLGRSGDIVHVRPGHAWNYLVSTGRGVFPDKRALRNQANLKEQREQQAKLDREESELIAKKLEGMSLEIFVKVDPDGHMYGSVKPQDIVLLLQENEQILLDRRNILTPTIKELGTYKISVSLKENVPAQFTLHVIKEV
ncbi:MAG TPA: 50S ribosomal protein L9 [Candidatus Rhabdochlamydia sp.]|jgi:large subunit ribosomal protein L9|nr:50S ribosomal protein L9 [Candidatus Rhabdochlamydia sp.]